MSARNKFFFNEFTMFLFKQELTGRLQMLDENHGTRMARVKKTRGQSPNNLNRLSRDFRFFADEPTDVICATLR